MARLLIAIVISMIIRMLQIVDCIIVFPVQFRELKTNRTDYAIVGESIELTCHYNFFDDLEDIKDITWSKDDINFTRWSKYWHGGLSAGEVYGYTFKGHFDRKVAHSNLTIHNVTAEMAGNIKCLVRTDLGPVQSEGFNLVVVTQSPCGSKDWRIVSKQTECSETLQFDCRHMFPKPSFTCEMWNAQTERRILGAGSDILIKEDEPLANASMQTYRVQYTRHLSLMDPDGGPSELHSNLIGHAGQVVLKCDMTIPGTSWTLGMTHRIFNFSDGCEQDPIEAIRQMRAAYNQYTRQRIQHRNQLNARPKQGDKLASQNVQLIDDHNSLATNFNLEILFPSEVKRLTKLYQNNISLNGEHLTSSESPPTSNQSSRFDREDLNCWRKPRLGSIVKLSCAGRPAKSSQAVKLIGSNLLECKSNGWNLIRETHLINNQILDKRRHQLDLGRRRKLAPNTRPDRTNSAQESKAAPPTSRQVTEVSNELDEESDDHSDEAALQYPKLRTPEIEDSAIPTTTTTTTMPPDSGLSLRLAKDDDKTRQSDQSSFRGAAVLNTDQLGTLLPSCVLVQQKRRNSPQKSISFSTSGADSNLWSSLTTGGTFYLTLMTAMILSCSSLLAGASLQRQSVQRYQSKTK